MRFGAQNQASIRELQLRELVGDLLEYVRQFGRIVDGVVVARDPKRRRCTACGWRRCRTAAPSCRFARPGSSAACRRFWSSRRRCGPPPPGCPIRSGPSAIGGAEIAIGRIVGFGRLVAGAVDDVLAIGQQHHDLADARRLPWRSVGIWRARRQHPHAPGQSLRDVGARTRSIRSSCRRPCAALSKSSVSGTIGVGQARFGPTVNCRLARSWR